MKPKVRDYYKQALEIIATEPDYKRLGILVAQNSPKVFCKAFEEISPTLKNRVRKEYVKAGKVPAIKMYRAETGEGLRESKEYVDAACSDLKAGEYYV